jgi:putative ABC transport system permease protein
MFEIVQILQGVLERGLIFSVVVAGVYLATQLINFDNLSIEGAFGLGGALTALLLFHGVNPSITLLCALLAGIVSGNGHRLFT